MTILTNVIDTRTGNVHSVAIVKESHAKFFVPVPTKQTKKTSTKRKKG